MDEDEDVVFEGSPLFEHLKSTGFTDFEVHQFTSDLKKECFCEGKCSKIECDVKQSVFKLTWNSGLLISDDKESLKYFSELYAFLSDHEPFGKSNSFINNLFSNSRLYQSSVIIVLLSIALLCIEEVFVVIALLLFIFCVAAIAGVHYWIDKRLSRFEQFFKELLEVIVATKMIMKKSIRTIGEIELIYKGFVLLKLPLHTNSNISSSAQMLKFQEVLQRVIDSVKAFHLNAYHNLEKYSEVSPYAIQDNLFETYLEASLNGLSHFKFQADVCSMQASAVFTQFLIIMCKVPVSDWYTFFSMDLFSQCKNLLNLLRMELNFASNFWLTEDEQHNSNKNTRRKDNIYGAVHCLNLHLQAALLKVRTLEQAVESDKSECENLMNLASVILVELQSAFGCLEEAKERIGKKFNFEQPPATNLATNPESSEEVVAAPLNSCSIDEYTPRDEIFEAYVEYESAENELCALEYYLDKERIKKEKEQAKRLLLELQPFLLIKKAEWEEREAKFKEWQKKENLPQMTNTNNEEEICAQESGKLTDNANFDSRDCFIKYPTLDSEMSEEKYLSKYGFGQSACVNDCKSEGAFVTQCTKSPCFCETDCSIEEQTCANSYEKGFAMIDSGIGRNLSFECSDTDSDLDRFSFRTQLAMQAASLSQAFGSVDRSEFIGEGEFEELGNDDNTT